MNERTYTTEVKILKCVSKLDIVLFIPSHPFRTSEKAVPSSDYANGGNAAFDSGCNIKNNEGVEGFD